MKYKNILYITVIAVILSVLQLWLSCRRAGEGDILSDLNNQTREIKIANQKLKQQIYSLTSITEIAEYARRKKYVIATTTRLSSLVVAAIP